MAVETINIGGKRTPPVAGPGIIASSFDSDRIEGVEPPEFTESFRQPEEPATFGDRGKSEAINKELDKIVEQAARSEQSLPHITALAGYIESAWTAARDAKKVIQQELYESGLQRSGKYEQAKINEMSRFSGSMVFMNITSVKCRAAEAWIQDVLAPVGDQIWDIEPTPIPELSPELDEYVTGAVQQRIMSDPDLLSSYDEQKKLYDHLYHQVRGRKIEEADLANSRMKRKISDQLTDAKWLKTVEEVISDIITYKAGIIKGPVVRRKSQLKWVEDEESQTWSPKQETALIPEYDRVSPMDLYPSPTSTGINDGYLIEHHRMTRQELNNLIGVPGYSEESIRAVLREYGESGLKNWLWEVEVKERVEDRFRYTTTPDNTIDAIEFWGTIQGKMLLDWGMDKSEIEDPDKEYAVSAWKIGNFVIKAIINANPIGTKPYFKASYESIQVHFGDVVFLN